MRAEFLGYHLLAGAEMTSQVIAKRDPLERVGNVVEVDGRLMVIEYSDLPDDVARRRNPDGSLAIWAGSIAVHVFDLDFLAADGRTRPTRCRSTSPTRKWPTSTPRAAAIEPPQPNAIKFERFIFDLMPLAGNAIVVEVDPASAFAPLKNASGARRTRRNGEGPDQRLHRQWLRAAGVEVAEGVAVEISPWFALDAEELGGKARPALQITEPTYLEK